MGFALRTRPSQFVSDVFGSGRSKVIGVEYLIVGGGGGGGDSVAGTGADGGGNGALAGGTPTSGAANRGGGGGGMRGDDAPASGSGGSGVVIVRYVTTDLAVQGITSVSGGTTSTSGNYTIHTFNGSSSLVVA